MYKEKHILNKTYSNHQLARYLDVYETTLQTDGHGTVSASKLTGYAGDNITLSNTPNSGYAFSAYTLTGANLTGNTFKLTDSDVTAKAWFYLPPVNAHTTYSMGNKFARTYLSNYSEFDEPDDVMNGYIEFGTSGSDFGSDRYFALKYGTRLANFTNDNRDSIVATTITLNNAYIYMRDHCFRASEHYINPCVNYYFPAHSPYVSTTDFFRQNWQHVGSLSGMFLSAYHAGEQSYSISATCLNATQNMLYFNQLVQPPGDGWTAPAYSGSNARWTGRDMCMRKFVFDKQDRVYYAIANGNASAKFSLPESTYSQGNITAIQSIKIANETNTEAAIFNLQVASFSSLNEACRW